MENNRQNTIADNSNEQKANREKINPFENNQSVNDDLASNAEELEKEQQFKEAQTERD